MRTILSKDYRRLFLVLVVYLHVPMAVLCAAKISEVDQPAKHQTLANAFAKIIESAIPLEYEKRKDWGKTKNITVGLRNEGLKLYRRKKAVKHGVWKHYQVKHIDPAENFSVQVRDLKTVEGGRMAFTMLINAKLDARGSAKVFQYGVHVITLVIEGDTEIELILDCEVGAKVQFKAGLPSVAIDPQVVDTHVDLSEFHLRRVSSAKGPLVKEMSSSLRKLIEHELEGPKLTKKLNRAIEKNRDHLELGMSDLVDSDWWPVANLPMVQKANPAR